MTTRRDFLKTMSLASAGLALGSGELLNAQTISSKKGRNEKVKIAYIALETVESKLYRILHVRVW